MANEIQSLDPLTIGIDRIYDCELYTANSPTTAITTYTASATFTAYFYRGDDQTSLFSPTCAWISASAGTFSVTLPATSTDDLSEGVYRLDVFITENSIKSHAVRASVEVIATAGSGTAPATYCTYEDMLKFAPWIRDQADPQEDQAGFAEQRGQARKWLDDLAHRHYRGQRYMVSGGFWTMPNTWGQSAQSGRDETLQEWLDDDRLLLHPDVIEACACQSIYYVLQGRLGPGRSTGNDSYGKYAAYFASRAKMLASTMTLEIDNATVETGVAGIRIDLSVTDTLYA